MPSHDPHNSPYPDERALVPAQRPAGARAAGDLAPPDEGGGASPYDPASLVGAFGRRWFLATAAGLVLMAAAAAAARYGWPVKYTASGVVHLSLAAPAILGDPQGNQVEFAAFQKAQQNLVRSQAVLAAAARELEGKDLALLRQQPDVVDWLQKELKTDFLLGPEAMRLSLVAGAPHDAKAVLEAVTVAYLNEARLRERERRQKRLDQLELFHKHYQAELARRRARQEELLKVAGSKDPRVFAAKYSYFISQLGETRKKHRDTKAERDSLQLELKAAEAKNPREVTAAAVDAAMLADVEYQRFNDLEAQLEAQLAAGAKVAVGGREAPGLRRIRQNLDAARADREAYRVRLRERLGRELADKANGAHAAGLEEMRYRLEHLDRCAGLLATEEKELEKQAEALNANQVNLEFAKQADGPLEKVTEQFGAEAQLLTLEMKAPPRVTRGEGPAVDWGAASAKRLRVVGVAGLAGLLLGVGLVTLLEARNGRVDGVQGIARGLGLPVLGQMPRLPGRVGEGRTLSARAQAARAGQMVEALDVTRTRLLHAARGDSPRMILVTSAVAGEGKTTLACHLAASLARSGRRTLLLDADMRRPAVHCLFEIGPGPGFAELLQGEAAPEAVLRQAAFPDLWLLPAGRWTPAAARALAQPRLHAVLTELKGRFDFVLVDSPPVLPVADALLLGARVDGVLFSVLHGVSQVGPLRQAADRLGEVGARLLGVVLNGTRLPRYGYSYGYSYEASHAPTHAPVTADRRAQTPSPKVPDASA